MRKSFDTFEYVDDLGKDLVRDFEKAGKTTHPHSVGEGREKSAINKLKDILPSGIGIGSGFVIDSFGNVSSQCDIIIYEKDLCLKFNSEDEKNCYYNCESVIAVGEVKSDLNKNDLEDSINKFKKIRNLKRRLENNRNFRNYLSKLTAYGAEIEIYDQNLNSLDQIFTFLLCNSLVVNYRKIIEIIKENKNIYEYPNAIVSIEGVYIGYSNQTYNVISALDGDSFTYGQVTSPFSLLLDKLFFIIEHGRSVRYNPGIYILKPERYSVGKIPIKNISDEN
ncbi:MAG: hypothetical protein HFJ58_01880 [Clostridia bacterium]|nr:hypothetical protein [Clostridia bacterium]